MLDFEFLIDILKKNVLSIISVLFGVAAIVGSGLYVYFNDCGHTCAPCDSVILEDALLEEKQIETSTIKVDVKGAVKNPGVYEFETGANIYDAIVKSGGLTSTGSTANLNLSKRLTDEMVVYVFTKSELAKKESVNEVVCEVPKCSCETITINECPEEASTSTESETDKVSINYGTLEELMILDGIGASKAQAIIDYREENGLFENIEDIMNVSGIGTSAYEKIKDNIKL